MAVFTFEKNLGFAIDGVEYILRRKFDGDHWQYEEVRTGRYHDSTDAALRALYSSGRLRPHSTASGVPLGGATPHREVPEEKMGQAKVRRAYAIEALKGPLTQALLEDVAYRVWQRTGQPAAQPHWTTVYRWAKKLLQAGNDIYGLIDRDDKRGNRKQRYPQEVTEAVERAIDTVYLKLEGGSIQDVLDRAIVDVGRENRNRLTTEQLPLPTRRLVDRLIKQIAAFDRCVARHGREYAIRKFRAVSRHRVTEGPLERAEIDHTPLDLMVVDDKSGLPLGRPYLTACIDDNTRSVLGIWIGFEPPSYLTVARCLRHAFMPKCDLRERYPSISNDWLAHGVMRELSMDNGPEFHSDSLENACLSLGIEIHYSPRKTPWFKGKIERFLGTLNASISHQAPGTTFSNIIERGDYDPLKHAVVRLGTLREAVYRWIVDVYHQKPHRTLGAPPAVLWKGGVRPEDIDLPEDPRRFDVILGKRIPRRLTHKGIEYLGLLYNSRDMTDLRWELGDRLDVDIVADGGDVGVITVLSPDGKRRYEVPALDQEYAAGLSEWQHEVCKRFAAQRMQSFDALGWREAKEQIAEMIRAEMTWTKGRRSAALKTRARAGRYIDASDQSAPRRLPHEEQPDDAAQGVPPSTSRAKQKTKTIPPVLEPPGLVGTAVNMPGNVDSTADNHPASGSPLTQVRRFAVTRRERPSIDGGLGGE